MDAERMNRFMEAKKYQEKAIKALFPENMQEHIDVIQGELSSMVKEGVFQALQSEEGMEFIRNLMNMGTQRASQDRDENKDRDYNDKSRTNSKVKKVTID